MKRLIIVLAALAACTAFAELMPRLKKTGSYRCEQVCNGGELIIDSGALTAGDYGVVWVFSTNATGVHIQIEHRNAANDANLQSFILLVPDTSPIVLPAMIWTLSEGERLRVIIEEGPLAVGTHVHAVLAY